MEGWIWAVKGKGKGGKGKGKGKGMIECWECGRMGHRQQDCPNKGKGKGNKGGKGDKGKGKGFKGKGKGKGQREERSCYKCGKTGHLAWDCWAQGMGNAWAIEDAGVGEDVNACVTCDTGADAPFDWTAVEDEAYNEWGTGGAVWSLVNEVKGNPMQSRELKTQHHYLINMMHSQTATTEYMMKLMEIRKASHSHHQV